MILSKKERQATDWYNQNGELWASQRKKPSEPSFWAEEYEYFKRLRKNQGNLLEIGSGSGREASDWMRMGYEYTGIDTSIVLLKIAQQNEPAGRYFHTSIYEMPFAPSSFDAFSSWAMLPHIPKERIGIALDAIRRVLKAGALGFVAMREGEEEKQESETGRWFSYYLQDEFKEILKTHGFDIVHKGRKPSRADLVWLTFFVRNHSSGFQTS
jgi:ubiquinone/menaquinone biosynthesis C-methylase UbiE